MDAVLSQYLRAKTMERADVCAIFETGNKDCNPFWLQPVCQKLLFEMSSGQTTAFLRYYRWRKMTIANAVAVADPKDGHAPHPTETTRRSTQHSSQRGWQCRSTLRSEASSRKYTYAK
jgi:hypothetical protein